MKKNTIVMIMLMVMCILLCACNNPAEFEQAITEISTESSAPFVENSTKAVETTVATEETVKIEPLETAPITIPTESQPVITCPTETQPAATEPSIAEPTETTQPEVVETLPPYMTDLG